MFVPVYIVRCNLNNTTNWVSVRMVAVGELERLLADLAQRVVCPVGLLFGGHAGPPAGVGEVGWGGREHAWFD